MNKYNWQNRITVTLSTDEAVFQAKIAVKTKETHWTNCQEPVAVLVSVQSAFHGAISGELKMNALMTILKKHLQGPITIILADYAHLNYFLLENRCTKEEALQTLAKLCSKLHRRYDAYFKTCKVTNWHSYIVQDQHYQKCLAFIKQLYTDDPAFRACVMQDVNACLDPHRLLSFVTRTHIVEAATNDIFAQCACQIVLAHKGYRFQFYPGKPNSSILYIDTILSSLKPLLGRLAWINVFISIEKLTKQLLQAINSIDKSSYC